MPEGRKWEEFAEWMMGRAADSGAGRNALLRRWRNLRELATEVLTDLPAEEVRRLLGKEPESLDPALNDLKAVIAYAAGKGLLRDPRRLKGALQADELADPLAFLAGLSGKAFGETWAPAIARYWLQDDGDGWVKKRAKDYYDVG